MLKIKHLYFGLVCVAAMTTMALPTATMAADCANPDGTAGEIIFNVDHKVLQYCNSEKWIAMGGSGSSKATGVEGEIQFMGADGKLATSSELHWDEDNTVLWASTLAGRKLGLSSTTTPSSGLSITHYDVVLGSIPANTWHFRQGSGMTSNISFGNYDNTPALFIKGSTSPASVNLGVGTVSPSYKLHVNGSVAGTGAYNALSDARFKTNVIDMTYGLNELKKLRPVTYEWITPQDDMQKGEKLGLIAQEVEAIFPQAVTTAADGTKSIAYDDLIPVLINAIKELESRLPPPASGGY